MIRRRWAIWCALALAAAGCHSHGDDDAGGDAADATADVTLEAASDGGMDSPGDAREAGDATPPDVVALADGSDAGMDASPDVADAADGASLPDVRSMDDVTPGTDVVVSPDVVVASDAAADASDGGPPPAGAPIVVGACRYWSQMPTPASYGPPASTDDGVFVGALDGLAMRYAGGRWSLVTEPRATLSSVVAGPSFTVQSLAAPGSTDFTILSGSTPPIPTLASRALSIWVLGTDVYAFTTDSPRSLMRYDGTSWSTVRSGITGSLTDLAGTPTNLYAIVDGALQRYDGSSWSLVNVGGYLNVVSPAPGEVYVLNASSVQQVAGTALTPLAPPPSPCGSATPVYRYLRSAPGYMLLAAGCSGSTMAPTYMYRRASPAGAWVALPVSSLALEGSIDAHGEVYATNGRIYHATSTGWQDLTTSEAPPNQLMTGDATHGWYAGGASGVARLVGEVWTPIPGAPAMPVLGLWASRDGTLFVHFGPVAGSGSTATALWRYASGTWTMLTTGTTGAATPAVVGRSATDLYFGSGDGIVHWDGTTTATIASPCVPRSTRGTSIERIYPAGDTLVAALCRYEVLGGSQFALHLYSGGTWSAYWQPLSSSGGSVQPSIVGVATDHPSVYAPDYIPNTGTIRTETAWVTAGFPAGYGGNVIGSGGNRYFASTQSDFLPRVVARTDGIDWTTISNWVVPLISLYLYSGYIPTSPWTDGRYVIGPSNGHGPGVAICDFGP